MSKASNLSRFVPSIEPTNNLNVGFVTATSIESTDATFNGNVSIAGTLTYEDVENVDSVGLITARSGVHVVGGGITVTGIATFHDNVEVSKELKIGTATTITSGGINVSGVATATDFVGINSVTVGSAVTITSDGIDVTGIVTATSFAGSGASITSIDAGNISTGIVTSGRLGGGTASSNTFLNGNGQFTAPGGGAWTYISQVTVSNAVTQIDFTSNIDSTYNHYVFVGRNVIPNQDSQNLYMRYFTSGGIQDGSAYHYAANAVYDGNVTRYFGVNQNQLSTDNGNAQISIDNTDAAAGTNFEYHLINPANTSYHTMAYGYRYNTNSFQGTNMAFINFAHKYRFTTAVTGVRFYMASGDIDAGTITLYGIKES